MRRLILGGTRVVGRHLLDAALAGGHQVTRFNRGQSLAGGAAVLPAGVTWLQGDRDADVSALASPAGAGGHWDAVVDTCAYLPAQALAGRVGRYLLISSVSAYASAAQANPEDAPLGTLPDPDTTVVDGRSDGPLKALCEATVLQQIGTERTPSVRPPCWLRWADPPDLPRRCWRASARHQGRSSNSVEPSALSCTRWICG